MTSNSVACQCALSRQPPIASWWRGCEGAAMRARLCGHGYEGAAMSWVTWVLILTGVGLNAAAQLLLKVATRPLAHFTDFSRDTLLSSLAILFRSLPFWTGMVCYGASV